MTLKNIYLDQFIKVVERAAYGASKFRGKNDKIAADQAAVCLLYTSPSPRDRQKSRMPSSA